MEPALAGVVMFALVVVVAAERMIVVVSFDSGS